MSDKVDGTEVMMDLLCLAAIYSNRKARLEKALAQIMLEWETGNREFPDLALNMYDIAKEALEGEDE